MHSSVNKLPSTTTAPPRKSRPNLRRLPNRTKRKKHASALLLLKKVLGLNTPK